MRRSPDKRTGSLRLLMVALFLPAVTFPPPATAATVCDLPANRHAVKAGVGELVLTANGKAGLFLCVPEPASIDHVEVRNDRGNFGFVGVVAPSCTSVHPRVCLQRVGFGWELDRNVHGGAAAVKPGVLEVYLIGDGKFTVRLFFSDAQGKRYGGKRGPIVARRPIRARLETLPSACLAHCGFGSQPAHTVVGGGVTRPIADKLGVVISTVYVGRFPGDQGVIGPVGVRGGQVCVYPDAAFAPDASAQAKDHPDGCDDRDHVGTSIPTDNPRGGIDFEYDLFGRSERVYAHSNRYFAGFHLNRTASGPVYLGHRALYANQDSRPPLVLAYGIWLERGMSK